MIHKKPTLTSVETEAEGTATRRSLGLPYRVPYLGKTVWFGSPWSKNGEIRTAVGTIIRSNQIANIRKIDNNV